MMHSVSFYSCSFFSCFVVLLFANESRLGLPREALTASGAPLPLVRVSAGIDFFCFAGSLKKLL
jgi:hypothetical protein